MHSKWLLASQVSSLGELQERGILVLWLSSLNSLVSGCMVWLSLDARSVCKQVNSSTFESLPSTACLVGLEL